jgi:hypothetical protein
VVVAVAPGIRGITHGCVLSLVAAAFFACGGADHGRPKAEVGTPSAEASVDPDADCAVAGNLTLQSITNFEPPPSGPNSHLVPTATCATGFACSMYYNFDTEQSPHVCMDGIPSPESCVQADGTPEPDSFCMTTNIPSPGASVIVAEIPGGRCGVSTHAFHLSGTNIAACYDPTTKKEGWGITYQITFNLDASSWDGISLWERRGEASSGGAVLFNVQDQYTVAASGCGALAATEPADPNNPPPPDALKCDPFGLGVGLTSDWQFVKIPFAKTQQKGFGAPSPIGKLDTTALAGVQFVFSPGDWDVWIDDMAFYREPS